MLSRSAGEKCLDGKGCVETETLASFLVTIERKSCNDRRTPPRVESFAMQNKRRASWCLLILAASEFINKRNEIKFFGVTQQPGEAQFFLYLQFAACFETQRLVWNFSGAVRKRILLATTRITLAELQMQRVARVQTLKRFPGRKILSPRRVLNSQVMLVWEDDSSTASAKRSSYITVATSPTSGSFIVSDCHRALGYFVPVRHPSPFN